MIRSFFPRCALALAACAVSLAASADATIDALAGDYALEASDTIPSSNWGYSKGRVSIRKLDDRHVLIVLACEWKRDPKAVCGDHYFAQQRDGGVYLQDMNTDWLRLYFDPAQRRLAMFTRAGDSKESVRIDIFKPTSAPLDDPALVRRMKRERANAEHKENVRVFGHHGKRAYQNNRIEFQSNPLAGEPPG